NAVWSGDSDWLIMRSNREGDSALYRQRADGTGSPERLTKVEGAPGAMNSPGSGYWSGQNQILPFTESKREEFDVWFLSMQEKKIVPLDNTPGSEQINPGFSPDGWWIAYSSNETGRFEIYVRPYPSTNAKFQITRDGGAHPMWAPDG